jgi:hypothetical protein
MMMVLTQSLRVMTPPTSPYGTAELRRVQVTEVTTRPQTSLRARETSDEGRRRLAIAIVERIGVAASPERRSRRIVSIELTEKAERRGLLLGLSAFFAVAMVGDTGFEPVTSRM